ncbi:MAG: ATP-dependent zinc metalloprotease FtsH [Pseudomonadota bacterium]
MEKRLHFSIWYFVLAVLLILIFQQLFAAQDVQQITYNQFKNLVRAGKIGEVVISPEIISGTVRDTKGLERILPLEKAERYSQLKQPTFVTPRIEDPDLVRQLQAAGVNYQGKLENKILGFLLYWIMPALFFVFLWGVFFRRMGGAGGPMMAVGKSKAKVYMEKETGVTFSDVAGCDESKEELMEIIEFLREPQKFQRLGGKIPKGVMLVGAPGTGKTLLAKAVAGEAGVPFFSMSGSDFVEMFVGVGAARVRDLFNQAQEKAPCIIFIDELDALGKARGMNPMGGHDEREQTLNQLLVEMDGFDTHKGVIIMAATNRPEILDPALLRPGRFDRHVLIDKPDVKGREAILKVHTKCLIMAPMVDVKTIAQRTPGFVGADLANICNEAALLAARQNKDAVEMNDFDEAIDRVVAGLEKKNRKMNDKEKEIVAYHESGHAIAAHLLPHADAVHKVSIIPRGVAALGYTQQLPTGDRYLLTKSELLERLCVLLGGRIAEELAFGEVSTGAQNDLLRATDIATRMVREYGMSDMGLVTYERERRSMFLDVGFGDAGRAVSEATAQEIDRHVQKIVEMSRERTLGLLAVNQDKLKVLAERLLEKEVVDSDELRVLLGPPGSEKAESDAGRGREREPRPANSALG